MDLKQLKQDYLDWEAKHTVFYPWSETVFDTVVFVFRQMSFS